MGSVMEHNKESRFSDASEHISQLSELGYDSPDIRKGEYDLWMKSPRSIRERRRNFSQLMGLNLDRLEVGNSVTVHYDGERIESGDDTDRIMESSRAVLRLSAIENEYSSRCSSLSSWSTDASGSSRGGNSNENFLCSSESSNGEIECSLHDVEDRYCRRKVRGMRLGQLMALEDSKYGHQLPSSPPKLGAEVNVNATNIINKMKDQLLSRLQTMPGVMRNRKAGNSRFICSNRTQRVRVRHCRRQMKELSAVFTGQDIQAHDGPILSMKFSFDGQYLASAGEDKIVRVWQVVEDERPDYTDIADTDPSSAYFSVNHLSRLAPLIVGKNKTRRCQSLRKTPDSACIFFPSKVFRILKKPLHVFHGHCREILDLSWSKNNYLLSSSVDKTVRLWSVGCDQCLKVFLHSDYVTCIQFNPVNDDYFISGSIDGKVRIWTVSSGQVAYWTEIREIITAISYRPDGQGGVIGSLTGTCRIFNIVGNHFQLEAQMYLRSKKKLPCKRITGFQFSPQDPSKVLVTCADSKIRVLEGMHVIGKYKGPLSAGNQTSSSFTSDGKHIISTSEDSNIYVWNYIGDEVYPTSKSKAIRSFECFSSDTSSIAIPWPGLKLTDPENKFRSSCSSNNLIRFSSFSPFSSRRELFLDSIPKVSATWPEEKLSFSIMCKSQYKLLKTSCQSSSRSHAWGLVIVTAGRDGRIRSFHNYGLPIVV